MIIHLEFWNYITHGWQISDDRNVIEIQSGTLHDFTKYCCFLCEYNKTKISIEVKNRPEDQKQADVSKRILAPLHIKFCWTKNFLKAMNKSGRQFKYLYFAILIFTKVRGTVGENFLQDF